MREEDMDFIEQWFGISPDGGNGATEILYVILAAVVIALLAWWRLAPHLSRTSPTRDR